jgi:protein-disulfide isomerase
VGLVLSALATAGGIWAFDHALTARAAVRSATLLGTSPAPAARPKGDHDHAAEASPATGAPSNWESEARRLQAILDDPHQLEHYFTDKAAREYAAAKVESPDLTDVPAKGPGEAPVKVVEYSDFLCPFCRNLAGALSSFLTQAGGRVQIFYKHYPLEKACNPNLQRTAHEGACLLAQGAICAQDQSKFWAYHDRVFARPMERATRADVTRFANEGGLDGAAFGACLDAPKTRDRLTAQIAEAKRVGVESTPTLLINGKKLPRINDFLQVVDKESQARGFAPMQPGGTQNH